MSRNNHPDHWDAQEHPSLDMLRQYQSGELPAPLRHPLEQHLVSCELCSDLLEGMTLAQPARVKSAVRETRGRLKNLLAQKKRKRKTFLWPIWQTAAVLLVLLFAVAEVVYHHYFATPEKTATEQTQPTPAETTWRLGGHVVDTAGKAVPRAIIKVKGMGTETMTNSQGEFLLYLPKKHLVLIVSHQDYKAQEVAVSPSNNSVGVILTDQP
ncbi:carboxypeptidase-like regulatory domain-containing protein [Rufibacter sp. XAAS-G3-1]|uniref:carboxypeptidase-like regulatory domain-containing protein n=1 Tax=Rufibacter sp. XAAS-G3-1 TaxID=2729134 RepID=UPI0015E7CCBA|nr:carboxypeptidase-like regulatory domain-containing protein [Rufibacter sp. XAAS-G3-1]